MSYVMISIVVILDLISYEVDYKLYRDHNKALRKESEINYRHERGKSSELSEIVKRRLYN